MIGLLLLFQLFPPADLARFHEQRIAQLKPGTPAYRAAEKDLGLFWLRNNQPAAAEPHLRLALPDAEIIPFLAEAVAAQNRRAEAVELFSQCRDKARCLTRLAQLNPASALPLLTQALKIEPTDARRNDLAQELEAAGQIQEAEALYRQAARNPAATPETATTWNNLASLLLATDRPVEAEQWQRKALTVFDRHLGPLHVRTGLAASNLADILRARGRLADANGYYRQALAIFEGALPAGHPWIREAQEALRAP